MADRELVGRARTGDVHAVGMLFNRYWRAARAAAFGVTGDLASAEDAAAGAFQEAMSGLESLRDGDRFGSWLRAIVVRRAQRERPVHFSPAEPPTAVPGHTDRPDHVLERLEMTALLHRAVEDLSGPLREAIALVYFEGYETASAARFLDIPAGTLRRRLHDGRQQLRRAVARILGARRRVPGRRQLQLERLMNLAEEEAYRALREMLALRPPPPALVERILRRHAIPATDASDVSRLAWTEPAVQARIRSLTAPSARATDSNHPVGAAAAAIRAALPEFQAWRFDVGAAASRFLSAAGDLRRRLDATLPPGFAEGRPGAFIKSSRGLVRVGAGGRSQSVYELLQESQDERAFGSGIREVQISDVLDLTWMAVGGLELRTVQDLLERIAERVIPAAELRFSAYDEPRYRSALQVHREGERVRLASGGVLAWRGCPDGVGAAHVRIYLEPWAEARSGVAVPFEQPPR